MSGEKIGDIESRVHEHERELSHTLETIRDKLTSRELVGELYERARSSGYPQALGRAVRDNPLPSVLAGVCAAWLAKSVRDAMVSERSERRSEETSGRALSEVALSDVGRAGEERSGAGADGSEEPGGGRVVQPPSARPNA